MIHRDEHQNNFVVVSTAILEDERLSWEARGFLLFLLSFSDSWSFNVRGLISLTGSTRSKIERLIKELKNAGYIKQRQVKNTRGQFKTTEWDVYETPLAGFTACGFHRVPSDRVPGNRVPENQQLTNINITNNNITNNKGHTKNNKKPTLEDVKAYCQERGNNVDAVRFFNYYESNGWRVGKNPMKDWRAAVRTWERSDDKPRLKPEKIKKEDDADFWAEVERLALKKTGGGNT